MDNIGTLLSHNVWQSIIIFTLVFGVLKMIKSTSAEERSWSWTAALFTLAILPLAAFLPGKGVSFETPPPATDFTVLERSATANVAPPQLQFSPIVKSKTKFAPKEEPMFTIPSRDQILSGLLLIWLAGTTLALIRLGIASYNANRLRQTAYPFAGIDGDEWPVETEIAVSDEISSPIVIGAIKPMVLIPRAFAFEMESDELKPLLYHELAHIKRGDTIFHLLERIVLAVYWWNPVMHLIARNIAEERELACDDRAAKHCGDQLVYASSLLKGARKLMGGTKPVLGLAALRRESVLSKRVKRLTIADKLEEISLGRFVKNLTILFSSIFVLAFVTPRIAVGQVGGDSSELNTVEMIGDGLFIGAKWRGNIETNPEETEVTALDNDGYLSIETTQNDITRKIVISALGDDLMSMYFVNGVEQSMAEEDRDWQANSLKAMLRLSGVNAEKRVDRLYKSGGSQAVLDEMELLHDDYAVRLYTEALVDIYKLEQDEVRRLLTLIDDMDSPYEKEMAIRSIADEQDLDEETDKLMAEVAMGIGDEEMEVEFISEVEFEEMEQEIEAEMESFPTEEEIQEMREEIERELENFPTAEEMERIREEALASLPTEEELKEMREEALASMMTKEELEEIRREAMESIPTAEEFAEIQKEAIESLPTREELEEIRREALESLPTAEELAEMHRDALESIPTAEEMERMRQDVLESIPTREELEEMRRDMIESLESLPSVEELQEMREDALNDARTHLQSDAIRQQLASRFSERTSEIQIQ